MIIGENKLKRVNQAIQETNKAKMKTINNTKKKKKDKSAVSAYLPSTSNTPSCESKANRRE